MKLFSTVLLSIVSSMLFASGLFLGLPLAQDQQQAHLEQVNLYLANPYVALPPAGSATLGDEDGIVIQDMRGVECFAQPDQVTVCGIPDTLSVLLYTKSESPIFDIELGLNFQQGLEYGGFAFVNGTNADLDTLNVDNPSAPSFRISEMSQDSGAVVVYVAVTATCDLDPSVLNPNVLFNLNYTSAAGVACTGSLTPEVAYGGNVLEPEIAITSTSEANIADADNDFCATVAVSQTTAGATAFGMIVTLDTDYEAEGITFAGASMAGVDVPAASIVDNGDGTMTITLDEETTPGYFGGDGLLGGEARNLLLCFNGPETCFQSVTDLEVGVAFACSGEPCSQETPATSSFSINNTFNFDATWQVDNFNVNQNVAVCGTDGDPDNLVMQFDISSVEGDYRANIFDVSIRIDSCTALNPDTAYLVGANPGGLGEVDFVSSNGRYILNLSNGTFTSDPDGPGVGLDDLDGDGEFDDLPGDQTITLALEFSQEPPMAGCATGSNDDGSVLSVCNFEQIEVFARRDCQRENVIFDDPIDPPLSFTPAGAQIAGDTTTNNGEEPLFFDFGTFGTPGASSREFEYTYDLGTLTSCDVLADRYVEWIFTGPAKLYASNLDINDLSANIAVISNVLSADSLTRTVRFDVDEVTDLLTLSFDMELDTAVCGVEQEGTIDVLVFDECGGICPATLLRTCQSIPFRAEPVGVGCVDPCNTDVIMTIDRISTGYTDRTLATELAMDETLDRGFSPPLLAGSEALVDTAELLPGDTILMETIIAISDVTLFEDLDRIEISLFKSGGWISSTSFWDYVAARISEFSLRRADGTTIDLGAIADGAAGTNAYKTHFTNSAVTPNIQSQPGLSHNGWEAALVSTGQDRNQDGRTASIRIDNTADGTQYNVDAIYSAIGGAFLEGDSIVVGWNVPIVRIPRESGYNDTDVARDPNSRTVERFLPRVNMLRYNDDGGFEDAGVAISTGICNSETHYRIHEPLPKTDAMITYEDTDGEGCDAEIVIDFTIDPASIASIISSGAYTNEYRPILGVEQFTAAIPASYYFDPSAATYELLNTPFNGALTFDAATGDPVAVGSNNYIASSPNNTTVTFTDLEFEDGTNWNNYDDRTLTGDADLTQIGGELPLLGVGGPALADPDTLRIRLPLRRICPTDVVGPLEVTAVLDYPYLGDYTTSPWLCGNSGRWFETTAGDCPGPFSFNIDRGSDGNPHRLPSTALYNEVNMPDHVSTAGAFTTPTVVNNAGGSETNTYTFTAGSDMAATDGVLLLKVPNAVALLGISGDATTFTTVGNPAGFTIYEVDMGSLTDGDVFTIDVETELLFCETADISASVLTGCLDDDTRAIAATLGIDCADDVTYNYLSGEVDLEVSLTYPTEQPGCTEETYTIDFVNNGTSAMTAFDPVVYLPEGLNLTAGSFMVETLNPANGPVAIAEPAEDASLTGVLGLGFTWPDAFFDNVALGTDEVAIGETVRITFMATASCDFNPGGAISAAAMGNNVCAEPYESEAMTGGGINPVPASTPTPEFQLTTSDAQLSCAEGAEPITITILNASKVDAADTEICLTLPAGLMLTSDDINPVAPADYMPVIGAPVAVGTAGASQVCFNGPDNLDVGSFLCFELDFDVSTLDCGIYEVDLSVSAPITTTCAGMTCEVQALGFSEVIGLEVVPALKVSEASIMAACAATDGNLDLTVDAVLENPGTDAYSGNLSLSLYQDLNENGMVDDFETALVGPSMVGLSIPAGETGMAQQTFTLPTVEACPLLLLIEIPGCNCGELVIPFDEVIPEVVEELGNFITLCPGEPYPIMADICGDLTFAFDPLGAGMVADNGGVLEISLNDGFGVDSPVTLNITSSIGGCIGTVTPILIEVLEDFSFEDVAVTVCQTGCQTVDLGIPFDLASDLDITITPGLYITDLSSATPEICDPATDITYQIDYSLNGQCMTSSELAVTTVAAPAITLTAATGCQTGFALGDVVSVTPADLAATLSSSGTGTFSPSTLLSDAPRYTPSAADVQAGEVMITVRTDNPDGPCAGAVARETFTILLVDCGSFPWGGE